jgi:hypothetical protein
MLKAACEGQETKLEETFEWCRFFPMRKAAYVGSTDSSNLFNEELLALVRFFLKRKFVDSIHTHRHSVLHDMVDPHPHCDLNIKRLLFPQPRKYLIHCFSPLCYETWTSNIQCRKLNSWQICSKSFDSFCIKVGYEICCYQAKSGSKHASRVFCSYQHSKKPFHAYRAPCWLRSSFLFSKFRRIPRACASPCFTHIGQYKCSFSRELQAVFAMWLPCTRAASLFQITKPQGWFLTAQPRPDTTWWACR